MIKVTVYLNNGQVIEFWEPKLSGAINMKDHIEHETFCHVVDGKTVFISADEVNHVEIDSDAYIAKHARAIVRGIVAEIAGRYGTVSNKWNRLDPDMQAKSIIRWREITRDVLNEV